MNFAKFLKTPFLQNTSGRLPLKLPPLVNDLQQLRSLYDEVELNVRSLITLGNAVESFRTLVSAVVIEKLPLDIKHFISRRINDTWNLSKILELLDEELKARDTVNVEGSSVDSDEVLPFTRSSLVAGSRGTSHQSMKCCSLFDKCDAARISLLEKSS